MEDKIVQVSGFGVENNASTQCDYVIVGVTESGKVLITSGDGKWSNISPRDTPDCEHSYQDMPVCVHCGNHAP